ncbi:MAG: hypothetical protein MI807_17140 [Verrucomicrobiales bacterium]|nr:hypothetical protein [Verrucomicrobiales bacterium]
MKHNRRRSAQRGSASSKMILFLCGLAVFWMVKGSTTTGKLMGSTTASVVAELGQPVTKQQMPRPR